MDILTPHTLSYTIHDYKREAKSTIERISAQGKLPIIVGGTNYYVDCLLWESLITKHEPTGVERWAMIGYNITIRRRRIVAFFMRARAGMWKWKEVKRNIITQNVNMNKYYTPNQDLITYPQ